MPELKTMEYLKKIYKKRVNELQELRNNGVKVIGTFCIFVPDELIFAAGADRTILCGGKNETIPLAEQYLPRNICPLIKSSLGSIVNDGCSGIDSCAHFGLVDMIIAENTCDGKKKMYEILDDFIPTYVIDLPQRPDTDIALQYFLQELESLKTELEHFTGNEITSTKLLDRIKESNEIRKLLHQLYCERKRDPSPISGVDVLKIIQKQFFLSPTEFKHILKMVIEEIEHIQPEQESNTKPRVMIAGCPLSGGNTKVPKIIEERGGVIVCEESCTGTRSFWDLVDEDENKDPMLSLSQRYINIPCSCMSPNKKRLESVVDLAQEFNVDGVIYYTLQFCHGYNIEAYNVQKELKKAGIPMLSIETDYSDSDIEQLGVRIDAFLEMIS
ncbi:double-cubane-cluster-containing anaerobic reductase [Methanosalsum natronophilum]|uniref:double-cubane-cluster-containing anaerobic reductase n=1 Tax=Methanosalsum natronophilum TaxID=768733 RepID=UPI0021674DA3|nr:double-cubane-cluster-containing anaerobic reductase [Methanosalsum natronophilum]MCS3923626.1 benzoyl-CoA reductase/2-hydroxyglutaryl-CoA dehydratase subunit BcrC/BadD/HgdB [Methanosalsum natronophilum]